MFANPDAFITGVGALLAGLAAVVSTVLGYRSGAKRQDADCDKRLKDIQDAMNFGMTIERRRDVETILDHQGELQ